MADFDASQKLAPLYTTSTSTVFSRQRLSSNGLVTVGVGVSTADGYIYYRSTETASFTQGTTIGCFTGIFPAVSANGDYVVVGHVNSSPYGNVGVYLRSGNVWSQQAILDPTPTASGPFGASDTAIAEDTADYVAVMHEATVYVYKRTSTTWSLFDTISTGYTYISGDSVFVTLSGDGSKLVATYYDYWNHSGTTKIYERGTSAYALIKTVSSLVGFVSRDGSAVVGIDEEGTSPYDTFYIKRYTKTQYPNDWTELSSYTVDVSTMFSAYDYTLLFDPPYTTRDYFALRINTRPTSGASPDFRYAIFDIENKELFWSAYAAYAAAASGGMPTRAMMSADMRSIVAAHSSTVSTKFIAYAASGFSVARLSPALTAYPSFTTSASVNGSATAALTTYNAMIASVSAGASAESALTIAALLSADTTVSSSATGNLEGTEGLISAAVSSEIVATATILNDVSANVTTSSALDAALTTQLLFAGSQACTASTAALLEPTIHLFSASEVCEVSTLSPYLWVRRLFAAQATADATTQALLYHPLTPWGASNSDVFLFAYGDLTTQHYFNAAAAPFCKIIEASLTCLIPLSANHSASVAVSSGLETAVLMSGDVDTFATSAATLYAQPWLDASAYTQASITASLNTTISLRAVATTVSTTQGTLHTEVLVTGSSQTFSTTAAELTHNILVEGNASVATQVIALLDTAVRMAAETEVQANTLCDMLIRRQFSSDEVAVAVAVANLTGGQLFSGHVEVPCRTVELTLQDQLEEDDKTSAILATKEVRVAAAPKRTFTYSGSKSYTTTKG